MASLKQVVQIIFDIVDQCYDLPLPLKNEIVDTGVFTVKDVLVGDSDSAQVPKFPRAGTR